jgi:hypothetical protein
VEQVVAAACGQVAGVFFLRAEGGVVELEVRGVGGQVRAEKGGGALGVAPHDGGEARGGGGVAGVRAGELAEGWLVGDVFVERGGGLLLAAEEEEVGFEERNGGFREEENAAGFELRAEGGGGFGGGWGGGEGEDGHG